MSDKRAITSAENGKKGGRPVSDATLRAQVARDYISQAVEAALGHIVAKAIDQAMEGNNDARNWLSSYSWGKPAINLGVDNDGKTIQTSSVAELDNDQLEGIATGGKS